MSDQTINIALIGGVSVGKSTLVNAIFSKQLSSCGIKRTTMVPTIYQNKGSFTSSDAVDNTNRVLIGKTEKGENLVMEDIKEIYSPVGEINDFLKTDSNCNINIYDIPGINDARTKELYFLYISQNFHKFNVIIFVIDIYSALNTSDEIEILEKININIKENKEKGLETSLIIIANKCDNMSLTYGKPVLDDELKEMYNQIKLTVKQKLNKDVDYRIVPLSSEDSYIYKVLKNEDYKLEKKYIDKFGFNEFGKSRWSVMDENSKKIKIDEIVKGIDLIQSLIVSGYVNFTETLNELCSLDKQKIIHCGKLIYDIGKFDDFVVGDYEQTDYMSLIKHCYEEKKKIPENSMLEKYYVKHVNKFITKVLTVSFSKIINLDKLNKGLAEYKTCVNKIKIDEFSKIGNELFDNNEEFISVNKIKIDEIIKSSSRPILDERIRGFGEDVERIHSKRDAYDKTMIFPHSLQKYDFLGNIINKNIQEYQSVYGTHSQEKNKFISFFCNELSGAFNRLTCNIRSRGFNINVPEMEKDAKTANTHFEEYLKLVVQLKNIFLELETIMKKLDIDLYATTDYIEENFELYFTTNSANNIDNYSTDNINKVINWITEIQLYTPWAKTDLLKLKQTIITKTKKHMVTMVDKYECSSILDTVPYFVFLRNNNNENEKYPLVSTLPKKTWLGCENQLLEFLDIMINEKILSLENKKTILYDVLIRRYSSNSTILNFLNIIPGVTDSKELSDFPLEYIKFFNHYTVFKLIDFWDKKDKLLSFILDASFYEMKKSTLNINQISDISSEVLKKIIEFELKDSMIVENAYIKMTEEPKLI